MKRTRNDEDAQRYMSTAKIGPKGQIVIPKDVRDMFDLKPGDSVIILADSTKGIAIERMGLMAKLADAVLSGKAGTLAPETPADHEKIFAENIKAISGSDPETAPGASKNPPKGNDFPEDGDPPKGNDSPKDGDSPEDASTEDASAKAVPAKKNAQKK